MNPADAKLGRVGVPAKLLLEDKDATGTGGIHRVATSSRGGILNLHTKSSNLDASRSLL